MCDLMHLIELVLCFTESQLWVQIHLHLFAIHQAKFFALLCQISIKPFIWWKLVSEALSGIVHEYVSFWL